MRTTIDLDPTVLSQLKQRARREGKTLGQVATEVLSAGLGSTPPTKPPTPLAWTSRPMGSRIDLEDPEAVRRALEDA